ncbi:MAG: outer membrane beta-barrel protein [Rhodospirillales bacterium]|nr:MAG: outer membrane beta-barrel protein [Rhodospirillales bacterium]
MRHPAKIGFSALLGLAVQLLPVEALAQEFYVDLHIGYNIVDDGDPEFSPDIPTSYEHRPGFGGTFGYLSENNVRIESELTWRGNDVDKVAGTNDAGRMTNLNLMLNLLYELEIGGGGRYGLGRRTPLRPYIGIGGGGGRYTLEIVPNLAAAPLVDDKSYALSYQGIVGLGIEIAESAMLTLDYRYLVSENVKFTDASATPFEVDFVQSTFMLGLRTSF